MLEDVLKKWFEKEIENKKEDLLENCPDNYDVHYDADYLDGRCIRSEIIYDEETLYEDARNHVIDSVLEMDISWVNLCENEDFVNEIVKMLKGM